MHPVNVVGIDCGNRTVVTSVATDHVSITMAFAMGRLASSVQEANAGSW